MSKTNADLFCQASGFPEADKGEYVKDDKDVSRQDIMKLKDTVIFVNSIPE